MSQYENKNTGVLFKNDRKTEDKHPDYTGTFYDADGGEHFFDAWVKKSAKSGGTFLSCRTKPKQAKAAAKPEFSDRPLSETLDDGIPF